MPYNPSTDIYQLPAIYLAVPGTVIIAAQHNTPLEDLATANNYPRPVIAGGTGANNITLAATNLEVVSYGAVQVLSDPEKLQARTNIGAITGDGDTLTDVTLVNPLGVFLSGYIYALTLTNNVSDATNDVDISAGSAGSDGATPALMTLASSLTKRIDAAWAVGNGNGGLDTGVVGNNTYYMWLIQRSDTGVVDALFSLSKTAPTMPPNYDRKAIIGSLARVSAANCAPRSYSQEEATPWVSYTPTIAGLGTGSSFSVRSRRNGGNIEISFKFTTGTVTPAEARMSLGFGGTSGNIVSDSTLVSSTRFAGTCIIEYSFAGSVNCLIESGVGYITFSRQGASENGFVKSNGNVLATNNSNLSGLVTIPIQGWN